MAIQLPALATGQGRRIGATLRTIAQMRRSDERNALLQAQGQRAERVLGLQERKFEAGEERERAVTGLREDISAAEPGEMPVLLKKLVTQYPEEGKQYIEGMDALDERGRIQAKERSDQLGAFLTQVQGLPPEQRPMAYSQGRAQLGELGAGLAEQYDPKQADLDHALALGSSDYLGMKKELRGGGKDGAFAKSPGVISRTEEGDITLQIPVMNKSTGDVELKSVAVPGNVVSRLGETGVEQSLRKASEAGMVEMQKRLVQLETAAGISGAGAAGAAAIRRSEKAFGQIAKIKTSIGNIDKAIELIDAGAKTGPIQSRLPSIRSASVQLDNVQKAMGLDVIGTTTFGALSKGELDLALSKALPTDLKEGALREWLVEKKAAQEKLSGYLENAAFFLGTPGNTVADWIAEQRKVAGAPAKPSPSAAAPQEGATATNPKGEKIIFKDGKWQSQ